MLLQVDLKFEIIHEIAYKITVATKEEYDSSLAAYLRESTNSKLRKYTTRIGGQIRKLKFDNK